jgi:hypothetical protein
MSPYNNYVGASAMALPLQIGERGFGVCGTRIPAKVMTNNGE